MEDVEIGDEVLATDPETGETRAEKVTAEIRGDGTKNLVKVTIDTDGDRGTDTAEITATDGHPFWVPELGRWIDATDLAPANGSAPAPAPTSRSPRSSAGRNPPPSTISRSRICIRTMCWRARLRFSFTTATAVSGSTTRLGVPPVLMK
ncbi:polymorphic toxin-type HINT domain-containing protein [Streptomyces cavourensis]